MAEQFPNAHESSKDPQQRYFNVKLCGASGNRKCIRDVERAMAYSVQERRVQDA